MTISNGLRHRLAFLLASILLLCGFFPVGGNSVSDEPDADAVTAWAPKSTDWPTFHNNLARNGLTCATATMKLAFYKWSVKTGGGATSSPAVADLQATGANADVVIGSSDNRLYCINGSNGAVRWRYQAASVILSSPSIGDLDCDGRPEVVFGSDDGRIYALNGQNGSLLWRYTTRGAIQCSSAIVDLDGDNVPEIVANDDLGYLYLLKNNGNLKQRIFIGLNSFTSPAIWDINNDGLPEIIMMADGDVDAYYGTNGSKIWHFSYYLPDGISGNYMSPVISDLDLNGNPEIIVAIDYMLFCLNGVNGTVKWYKPIGGNCHTTPAIGDGDSDGLLEIYFGTWGLETNIHCLDGSTGREEWNRSFSNGFRSSPALSDIDGDKKLELIIGGDDNMLHALNAEDGTPTWAYLCPDDIRSSPAVADIDNDGKAEIIFGCVRYRIYALDYGF